MKTLGMILLFCISNIAFAQQPPSDGGGDKHPCKEIMQACKAAGFYKGGHKKGPNKGIFEDCMKPIKNGQTVPGVTLSDPNAGPACKAREEKHRAHHGGGDNN
jgi:hypothetical protein